MVKLDLQLLSVTDSYINAVKDRELDVQNYKIPAIENLALTKDQNDAINFSNNDIQSLTNFPPMRRLTKLYVANNRITKIDHQISKSLPNLETLILTNNQIKNLEELNNLSGLRNLKYLSLVDNPCTRLPNYRLYLIKLLKNLRVIDFIRIKDKERKEANETFKDLHEEEGTVKKMDGSSAKTAETKTFELRDEDVPTTKKIKLTAEEEKAIREKIANVTSLDEFAKLEKQLKHGY
ncbi:hypothetical protein HDU92_004165 [Lobulomyces angularis]|nr:hypothetical protein HDU92_004165 [Lobulomyces angularis]